MTSHLDLHRRNPIGNAHHPSTAAMVSQVLTSARVAASLHNNNNGQPQRTTSTTNPMQVVPSHLLQKIHEQQEARDKRQLAELIAKRKFADTIAETAANITIVTEDGGFRSHHLQKRALYKRLKREGRLPLPYPALPPSQSQSQAVLTPLQVHCQSVYSQRAVQRGQALLQHQQMQHPLPQPPLPPPPQQQVVPPTGRERDIHSCRIYKTVAELKEKNQANRLEAFFQTACSTPEFAKGWLEAGFQMPSFHANTSLSSERRKQFYDAVQGLPDEACLGVVFHGTSTQNIAPILKEGLDPTRRRGQGYGPGEYFSKNPSVSVSYCKGGLEMLVFVVVLPSTLPPPPPKEEIEGEEVPDDATNGVTAAQRRARRGRRIPPYFVVVENNAHQIPIGTVQFGSVEANVISESQRKANLLKQLNKKLEKASLAVKETQLKAEIIQDLIASKVDVASEKYQKHSKALSDTSKKEISWYVHQMVDHDVVFCYFQDLPEPMDQEEFHRANIPSVDQTINDESKAKEDLIKAKQQQQQQPTSITSGQPPRLPHLFRCLSTHPLQASSVLQLNESMQPQHPPRSNAPLLPPPLPLPLSLDSPTTSGNE